MKLINQRAEYWSQEDLYKQIERCARVCYKSEDKITDDSAKKMVDRLIQSMHLAMLEHGTVYLKKKAKVGEYSIFERFFEENPYSRVRFDGEECCVTTNLRVIVENCLYEYMEYQCEPTKFHNRRYTMFLTTSIGIVRELLRHRKFSFANESTRYCNYTKDKFDRHISFVKPYWLKNSDEYAQKFIDNLASCESCYNYLINEGHYKPQEAREILPLATKSDIVMTGFEEDWAHFFDLRLEGSTGAPHPDMKILAQLIEDEFDKNNIEV